MNTVRQRRRRRGVAPQKTPTAAALAVAVALAGCGGSDGAGSTDGARGSQPLAQFRTQADTICAAVSKRLARTELPHSFPADLKEFDKGSKAVLAVIEQPFTKLAAIAPPVGQEATFTRFAASLDAAVAEAKQLRRLVDTGNDDTDALWLPRTNVKTHQAKAMNEAIKLGLESCDELDYKEAAH